MIDLENREYLRIAVYWKDWAICFVMKNGLAYMVSTKIGKNFRGIAVAFSSLSHTKMAPTVDDVTTIPQEELEGALYNLQHEKIMNCNYMKDRPEVTERWLKWTRKYQAVIDDLALYYAEKQAHCSSPVEDIRIEFENRDYVEAAGWWPGSYVCFVMKNGLAYCVGLESKEIYIDVHPYAHFNDYGDFFIEADKIPQAELAQATQILRTAPLPEMSGEDIKGCQYWLQLQRHM